MKLVRADEWILDRIKKLSKIETIVFFSALFTAIVVNIPAYTLRVQCPDGVFPEPFSSWYWDLQLGRFMLAFSGYLRHFFNIVYYIDAIGILFIALTATLLCKIVCIKNGFMAVLIGIMIGVLPTYAWSTQIIYYVVPYIASSFFSILAIYLSIQKKTIILGSISMCIALGFYQNSIAVAITLAILLLICSLLDKKIKAKEITILAGRMLSVGVLGGILYGIIYYIVCKCLNISTAIVSYSGVDSLTSLENLIQITQKIYSNIYSFYLSSNGFNNSSWGFNIFNIILLAIGVLSIMVRIKRMQIEFWRILASIILLFALPFGMLFILVLSPAHDVSWGHALPLMLPILFGISSFLHELELAPKKQLLVGMQYVLIVALILLCGSYWKYNESNYLAMELTQNKTISLANRLVSDMEEIDGYTPGMKIMICGTENPELYPRIHNQIYDATNYHSSSSGMIWADLSCAQMEWTGIMRFYIGISYQQATIEDFKRIIPTEQYQNMPLYPARGSIQMINDTMVVKLANWYNDIQY